MTTKCKRRWLVQWIDKSLSSSRWRQILILVAAFALVMVVALVVVSLIQVEPIKDVPLWLLPFYLLIDTNALNNVYMLTNDPWTLVFSCLVYLCGLVIFSGMLISIVSNVISRRVDNYRNGVTHYLKSGHTVILGYDDLVPSIIVGVFKKNPHAYVLLMSSIGADVIREKLAKSEANAYMNRVIVNYGHRTSMEYYDDIYLTQAAEAFVVGNRSLPHHDAMNVECMDSICRYLKDKDFTLNAITCVFEDLDTYEAFKTTDIFNEMTSQGITFTPYNFYASWAKQLFVKQQYEDGQASYSYPALDRKGITFEDDHIVHLVFLGTSTFAISLAQEAVQVLHFPNFNRDVSKKTRVTFIDVNADVEERQFMTRNRHFFEVADFQDVEFEFIKGDIFSSEIQQQLCEWVTDEMQYVSVFLAMTNQRDNFAVAMNLPDEVYASDTAVFVRQDVSDKFLTSLRTHSEVGNRRYAHLYPFGMTNLSFETSDVYVFRAQLLHYLYHTADYDSCQFKPERWLRGYGIHRIQSEAYGLWRKLPVALQWSNLYAVYHLPYRLRTLRAMRGLASDDTSTDLNPLTDKEVEVLAHVEHNRWMVEKLLMGYRKPKPFEKGDKQHFIHEDIRPYHELQKTKALDAEIVRYIPWLLCSTQSN